MSILRTLSPTQLLAASLTGAVLGGIGGKFLKGEQGFIPGMLLGASLGFAGGTANNLLRGSQSISYDKNKDEIPYINGNNTVIAFSGGAGGDWRGKRNLDKQYLDKLLGDQNYKLFSYPDVDLAAAYLNGLPRDARVHIIGHSMGGPAAYLLALAADRMQRPVDTLITVDPVGTHLGTTKLERKPFSVAKWYNYYPSERHAFTHGGDTIAAIGGAYDKVEGAINRAIHGKNANHTDIRNSISEQLQKRIAGDSNNA